MNRSRWALFVLEAVFSVGTGLALLLFPGGTLDLYGLDTDPVGMFMTQNAAGLYIGVGVLAWLARNVSAPQFTSSLTTTFLIYHLVLLVVALNAWLGSDFDFELGWVSVIIEAVFALAFGYFRFHPIPASGGRS
jgi:hypothetical protein